MLEHGLMNMTNWLGNVILPTLAGLFFAGAIYGFSKGHHYQHLSYAGCAALLCSGFVRLGETFAQQAAWNDPDRYWISVLTLVNWVGNVIMPLYGVTQLVLAVLHFAGLLERLTVGEAWIRNFLTALLCFSVSGVLRLVEFFIQNGKAGVG